MPDSILSLTTTVASAADAERLARGLLDRRLAACVQVEDGVGSHYRWQGSLHRDAEWRLTVKTLPAALAAIQAYLGQAHPYQLPQLLWQEMQAGPAYAAWVREQVDLPAG